MQEHKGRCFCGAVEISIVGEPVAVGYCHCTSCRKWAAAPVNAFSLWQPSAVKVVKGAELVGGFMKTERSNRKWCTKCGGHLFTEHPTWGVIDVYAATFDAFPFEPKVHVNYAETVLRMHDGLTKLTDYPKEMGGTGNAIPE